MPWITSIVLHADFWRESGMSVGSLLKRKFVYICFLFLWCLWRKEWTPRISCGPATFLELWHWVKITIWYNIAMEIPLFQYEMHQRMVEILWLRRVNILQKESESQDFQKIIEWSSARTLTSKLKFGDMIWFRLIRMHTWYDAFHVVLLFAPNFHQLQRLQIPMCHPDRGRRLLHGFAPSIPGGLGSEGGRRADKYGSTEENKNSMPHESTEWNKRCQNWNRLPMLSHSFRLVAQNERFPGTTFFFKICMKSTYKA